MPSSSSSVLPLSLELGDTTIYEPQVRALLGTAPHFCEAVVLKLRTVPLGAALSLRIQTVEGKRRIEDWRASFKLDEGPLLVPGSGLRVQGAGCGVQGSGCMAQGAGCRVQVAGFSAARWR